MKPAHRGIIKNSCFRANALQRFWAARKSSKFKRISAILALMAAERIIFTLSQAMGIGWVFLDDKSVVNINKSVTIELPEQVRNIISISWARRGESPCKFRDRSLLFPPVTCFNVAPDNIARGVPSKHRPINVTYTWTSYVALHLYQQ